MRDERHNHEEHDCRDERAGQYLNLDDHDPQCPSLCSVAPPVPRTSYLAARRTADITEESGWSCD
jgi:hypothetical protein